VGVSQGGYNFSPIPGVIPELEKIEKWFKDRSIQSSTLLDNAAQKEIVIEKLKEAEFLHIACHGTSNIDRPDQSGLVLITNKLEILSIRELSELDLTRLRHATLSSCWSADPFISSGRWIISLPETLWRSGTQSILGCLWEVNDEVAVQFMTCFYHYLKKLPRDEALRQTQLKCLQDNLPNFEKRGLDNPIYWSGFNLYGEFRKLDLRP